MSEHFDLVALRKRLDLNQSEMAERMGMGSRAYFTIEQDPTKMNIRHARLAAFVSLQIAVERKDATLAHPDAAKLARDFANIGKRGNRAFI